MTHYEQYTYTKKILLTNSVHKLGYGVAFLKLIVTNLISNVLSINP